MALSGELASRALSSASPCARSSGAPGVLAVFGLRFVLAQSASLLPCLVSGRRFPAVGVGLAGADGFGRFRSTVSCAFGFHGCCALISRRPLCGVVWCGVVGCR